MTVSAIFPASTARVPRNSYRFTPRHLLEDRSKWRAQRNSFLDGPGVLGLFSKYWRRTSGRESRRGSTLGPKLRSSTKSPGRLDARRCFRAATHYRRRAAMGARGVQNRGCGQRDEDQTEMQTIIIRPAPNPGVFFSSVFVVGVGGRAEDHLAAIRDTIQSVDPQVPLYSVKTMQQRLDEVFARPSFYRIAICFFAGFALLLTMISFSIDCYLYVPRTKSAVPFSLAQQSSVAPWCFRALLGRRRPGVGVPRVLHPECRR